MIMMIVKVALLFLATAYGVSIIGRMAHKEAIYTEQILLFTTGFVGFVTLQFNLLAF